MTVKINGSEWKVSWVKENSKKLLLDGSKCWGITCFDEKRIYLDKDLPKKAFRETAVHELTHAFLYEYDIDLVSADDVEENVCGFMEKRYKKIVKLAKKITKAWEMRKTIIILH